YLNRTQTGHFDLIPEYTIEHLESLTEQAREALLLPVYAPIDHFPKVQVPEGRAEYFSRGMESNIEHVAEAEVLVFDGDKCLGLAEITDKKRLVPKRVLNL
ncbi:MAG: tRNA pseudouridine(55) synthase TruB, partial [Acinetobacter sp.]|nr:tRNA pseudouridine(55) synthase TruB [Acinetobacter sp.]